MVRKDRAREIKRSPPRPLRTSRRCSLTCLRSLRRYLAGPRKTSATHPVAVWGSAAGHPSQLPVQKLLMYTDLKHAILQLFSLSIEQHSQRLQSGNLREPIISGSPARDGRWTTKEKSTTWWLSFRIRPPSGSNATTRCCLAKPSNWRRMIWWHVPVSQTPTISLPFPLKLLPTNLSLCPGP